MRRFMEKSFIMVFCLYNAYNVNPSMDLVFYFLLSIVISLALDLFQNNKLKSAIYLIFIIICLVDSLFVYYLPLILYNMYLDFKTYAFFPIPIVFISFSAINLLISLLSIYLASKMDIYSILLNEYKVTRDRLKEDTLYLKKYNEQLKIDKEKNIHIAILTERNRIARELHDSIGHAISSSILQVEALKITSDDNRNIESLDILQGTLENGMDDIRKSIHNLYNESLELESQIEKLCNDTPNLDIEIDYKIEDKLSYDLKFDILSIVKEGITNCVKHSNASKLKISLLSQPKFHSIIIKDNGTKFDEKSSLLSKGIGLSSMGEIANKYNGFLNYEFDEGFKVHLTLMKG